MGRLLYLDVKEDRDEVDELFIAWRNCIRGTDHFFLPPSETREWMLQNAGVLMELNYRCDSQGAFAEIRDPKRYLIFMLRYRYDC